MKATTQTVIIWLFLLFVTGESLNLYFKANSRANRLESNLITANKEAEAFKTKNGQNASKLIAQELTISELRKINPQIISQLKNLYIPPRLAESYTQTSQTLKAEITAPVTITKPGTNEINDTQANLPVRTNTKTGTGSNQEIRHLEFSDKWINVKADLSAVTGKITVEAKDSIFTAVYKGARRHPLFWIFSRRQYTAAATNRSPYISIKVIQSGVIKK